MKKKLEVISKPEEKTYPKLNMKRVKHFSHTDLDGLSCTLVSKQLFDKKSVCFNYEYLNYGDFNRIIDFLNNSEESSKYDLILITDLNISMEVGTRIIEAFNNFLDKANNINLFNIPNFMKKMIIIDHHKDSLWLNEVQHKYIEYYNNEKDCATRQLYNFIIHCDSPTFTKTLEGCQNEYPEVIDYYENYTNIVNDWDLFLWIDKHNMVARDLGILCGQTDRNEFLLWQIQKCPLKDKIVDKFYFNKTEIKELKKIWNELDFMVDKAITNSIVMDYKGYFKYLLLKENENVSMLSYIIREKIKSGEFKCDADCMCIVMFNHNSVSVRQIKDDFNCREFANLYGGGGHPAASGFPIHSENEELMQQFIYPVLK